MRLSLKQQLEQMIHVCDVLEEDHPHHGSRLEEIRSEARGALLDVMEPEGKHLAMHLLNRVSPELDRIAVEEAAPDTDRSSGVDDRDTWPAPPSYPHLSIEE